MSNHKAYYKGGSGDPSQVQVVCVNFNRVHGKSITHLAPNAQIAFFSCAFSHVCELNFEELVLTHLEIFTPSFNF
jgi:hypothetical protein